MAKDLYKRPFSQETITKLEIFEAYFRAWLPVFIQSPYFHEVNICDFFAGAGQDSSGVPGSSLRIVSVIKEYEASIVVKKLKVKLFLNEIKKRKFNEMEKAVKSAIKVLNINSFFAVEYFNEDFQKLFHTKANEIKDMPNLIFLDQSGIKQITQDVFAVLESFSRTDFMFFIASSFFNRFSKTGEFQEYFPGLETEKIKEAGFENIHRVIADYYRGRLPAFSKTRLYPFTIKKGKNIYGLIFGSKNVLGAEKFLRVVWDKNKINGEANFDIDDDVSKQQAVLFEEMKRKTKKEKFQNELNDFILKSRRLSNKQIYDFVLDNGFLPSHATEIIRGLKKSGSIKFEGHSRISYDKCYKNPEEVIFESVR